MAGKVRPIKPSEVTKAKKVTLPDAVLEAFNEMIVKHLSSAGYASFKQDDVVALIISKMGLEGKDRYKIFDSNWLDVEDVYRAEGWKVEYDSPAYCEDYPAIFKFSRRR